MIFINYRKKDSQATVDHIADRLKQRFGELAVFKDDVDIRAGERWPERLRQEVDYSQIVIVIVGPSWLTAHDQHYRRRIDDPNDWVRLEIESSLASKKHLIVVLLDDTPMPPKEALPSGLLSSLPEIQALRFRSGADSDSDILKLTQAIEGSSAYAKAQPALTGARIKFIGFDLDGTLIRGPRPLKRFDENNSLNQRRLITDRFSQAIEHLGSDKLEVRIGGILTLEGTVNGSPDYHWQVMEVLTAFVSNSSKNRRRNNCSSSAQADIQSAITVIGRRNQNLDPNNRCLQLSESKLSGVNLYQLDFCKANFYKANLSCSSLKKVRFVEANLKEANLVGSVLKEVDFSRAKLLKANISSSKLKTVLFQTCSFEGADLQQVELENIEGYKANFSHSNLSGANIKNANLREANLKEADLYHAILAGSDLSEALINGADLSRADLSHCNLSESDLSQANLIAANLSGANLSGAILAGADLSLSDLSGANLAGADLSDSDLTGADVSGVEFENAILLNAIMPDGSPFGC